MQFRDIFTHDLLKEPELLQIYAYGLRSLSNVLQDVTNGEETISLPPQSVILDYATLQFSIKKGREQIDGVIHRLEKMKKIEVLKKTDSYCAVKIKGIQFPIVPILDMVDPKSTMIPIEFDEWKRKDLKYIQRELSEKYYSLAVYVFRDFSQVAGEKMLHELTKNDYEAFIQHIRSRNVSDTTVNDYTRVLKASLGRAKAKEHITVNPFEKLKPIRVARKIPVIISQDELHHLIGQLENPIIRACILCSVATGMRRGEVTFLRWRDIDEEHIVVRSSESHRTKFRKERNIPLTPFLHDLLQKLKKYNVEKGFSSEFVFPNGQGNHFHENYLCTSVKRASKRAGFEKNIGFHTFRRTFASLLKRNGVKTDVIGGLLGHSNERVTNRYLSVFEEDMERAMYSIDLTGGKNVGTLLLQNT